MAYNFGLPASGPHQMLALLESKDVSQVLEGQRPVAAIYQALPFHIQRVVFAGKRTEADRKLFIEIVKKSKEIFESKYGGKFYVIYWDEGDSDDQEIIEALRREGVQVIPVSNILGAYKKNKEKYHLKEGHPNKLAYQTIAQYLLNENF